MAESTILHEGRNELGLPSRVVVVVDLVTTQRTVRHVEVEVQHRDAMGDSSWRREQSFAANDIVCQTLITLAEKAGDL